MTMTNDNFFLQRFCDRCGGSLSSGRTMSMYNKDCICMKCKAEECKRDDYKQAQEVERQHIMAGDYNYHGIAYGYKKF